MSWSIPFETLSFSRYYFRDSNSPSLFLYRTQEFRLTNLETLTLLAYSIRDIMVPNF